MTILIDPTATAGLVAREVRNGVREDVPTKIAVARRVYATDRADLWDAVTSPERLPRWFAPVTGELRLGGRYQVEGNASGTVETCTAPESFGITWEFGPGTSWVTVTLTEREDGTELELAHESAVDPDFWTQFGPGAVGVGWDLALMGLGLHLAGGESADPAEAEAWYLGPQGKEFVGAAATDWARAAVGAGDDEETAAASAQQVLAFYTTAPES